MKRPTKDSSRGNAISATFRSGLSAPFHRRVADDTAAALSCNQPETDDEKLPVSSRVNDVISRYRPVIERVVLDGLVGIAEDKLQDDVLVASIFNKAYELLPTPVRLVLPREKCLNWLMQNREPLLLKLGDYHSTSSESGQQTTLSPPTEK